MDSNIDTDLTINKIDGKIEISTDSVTAAKSSNIDNSDQKQTNGDGLSKKGRKRLLMQEIRKDAKKIKKLKEKEKKKSTNSRSFRISSALPVAQAEGSSGETTVNISRKERKESGKIEFAGLCVQNFTVIIDLNWEEHHTEKALKSLKQVLHN